MKMIYKDFNVYINLPNPLSKQEQLICLKMAKEGNKEARDKLIMHNLRLITNEIKINFKRVSCDSEELFSIGVIGLIKAIDKFDIERNVEFSTYAAPLINGEIKRFLSNQQKIPNQISMEIPINIDKRKELKLEDVLSSDLSIEEEYEKQDIYKIVNSLVNDLPSKDREIVKLYFGFGSNQPKTQKEVAKILNVSQGHVSMSLKKATQIIEDKLWELGLLEDYDLRIKEIYKNKVSKKAPQTIYKLLNLYSKNQVDEMLTRLNEEEKKLIMIKYGTDLEHPVPSCEWQGQNKKKFDNLYKKMRYLLANPEIVSKEQKKKVNKVQYIFNCLKNETEDELYIILKDLIKDNLTDKESYEEQSYFPLLSYSELLQSFNLTEVIIIYLKFGYVGKSFSTKYIASFLDMKESEVRRIVRKVLLYYQDKLDPSFKLEKCI